MTYFPAKQWKKSKLALLPSSTSSVGYLETYTHPSGARMLVSYFLREEPRRKILKEALRIYKLTPEWITKEKRRVALRQRERKAARKEARDEIEKDSKERMAALMEHMAAWRAADHLRAQHLESLAKRARLDPDKKIAELARNEFLAIVKNYADAHTRPSIAANETESVGRDPFKNIRQKSGGTHHSLILPHDTGRSFSGRS